MIARERLEHCQSELDGRGYSRVGEESRTVSQDNATRVRVVFCPEPDGQHALAERRREAAWRAPSTCSQAAMRQLDPRLDTRTAERATDYEILASCQRRRSTGVRPA